MATERTELVAALEAWRDSLVNLSGANRSISFRPSKTGSVLIDSPDADVILRGLESKRQWAFEGDPDADQYVSPEPSGRTATFSGGVLTVPADNDVFRDEPIQVSPATPPVRTPAPSMSADSSALHSPRPNTELGPVIRGLMRRANQEFVDRGVSVLYLAFGALHWFDIDGTALTSPLLLVPVRLVPQGPRGTPKLELGDDEYVVNPGLGLRLEERGIHLPAIEDLDGLPVSEVLERIRHAVPVETETARWEIKPTIYLSTFSFAKEAMYRDLQDNEDQILEHPIVRALATSDPAKQTSEFDFEPIDPATIDVEASAEITPLVLNADSSQRVAIAAALAGKTFVMDGPPGTGKSQTIANMIGALLHAGKTVLFVSEKIAALDVVRNRLAHVGLGNYLMELHSHKASRKEVAAELLRALDNQTVDPGAMSSLSRSSLRDRQSRLNGYAVAMNEVRSPLNFSLHQVLGTLSDLAEVASAPIPERAPSDLTQGDYQAVLETLQRLTRAWRPAEQGHSFLWRDVEENASLDLRLYQAGDALDELSDQLTIVREARTAFGFYHLSDVPRIVDLVALQHTDRPEVMRQMWLELDDLAPVRAAYEILAAQIQGLTQAAEAFRDAADIAWQDLSVETVPAGPTPLVTSPDPIDLAKVPLDTLHKASLAFEGQATTLRAQRDAVQSVSTSLGLGTVSTLADITRVIDLVALREHRALVEPAWLTRDGLAGAQQACAVLRDRERAHTEAERRGKERFTPSALESPVAELKERFTTLHKGLKKLSSDYRADKKLVAGLLTDASAVKDGIRHLNDAISWSTATAELREAVAAHASALGAGWRGRETNFDEVERGLSVASEALRIWGRDLPGQYATYLARPGGDDGQQRVAATARSEFDRWCATLAPAPALTGRFELTLEPLDTAIAWLLSHSEAMGQAARRITAVTSSGARADSLDDVERLVMLRQAAAAADTAITESEGTFQALFGEHYNGPLTDADAIATGLAWADRVRALNGGCLNTTQISALESIPPLTGLTGSYEKWAQRRDHVIRAFSKRRHDELRAEFDDPVDARSLIDDLRTDTVGQDEWFHFQTARTALGAYGLGPAVDFCIDRRLPAQEVPKIVQRALLRAWADTIIRQDDRLDPQLAAERETLIAEYKRLDREAIHRATSDIIRSVNTRRPPRSALGEPAVIRKQGMLKRKHMPVRDLIRNARNTALALKPCFMMSPLAVSQYLPPNMDFDVVIFDEASQVTPGDAINCIYRGKALILAGDDKQLPPTSFFERVVDDEGNDETDANDFQSILESAKGSGAFPNLGLRWHYRSRHEDLISFSNYKFYEGNLITYPSAKAGGEDVGIDFFHAHGTYRRGAGANNPVEAERVAERVIEHYTNRPGLTLGVVTFSVAQADAVTAALDKAREARPDLEQYFDQTDRLNGFFIRSLESVQGDERDVIIFSVGYGPDEAGKISTNFGVLNKPKGWRRLNVGITRARQRVEVVASMRAGDIPQSENENVEYLRAYLDYAEKGIASLAAATSPTGLGPDSPFEESVLAVIRNWGYTVEPQVGSAGFRIDIGVRHPVHPGMFAIGIECDGFQYHSSPVARDRDRLREEILRGLGWEIHRIWGTAWYRNRKEEEVRLRAAIDAAIAAPIEGRHRQPEALERAAVETVELDSDEQPTWTMEYRTAPVARIPHWVNPAEPANYMHLATPIAHLVAVEGPVHLEVVYERVRDWWAIGRVSYKLRDTIDRAARAADLERDGQFLLVRGRTTDQVRVPSNGVARKAEHVHVSEIGLAVVRLLEDIGTEDRSSLVRGVARLFGWARVGATVEQAVNTALDDLAARGRINDQDGRISLVRWT